MIGCGNKLTVPGGLVSRLVLGAWGLLPQVFYLDLGRPRLARGMALSSG